MLLSCHYKYVIYRILILANRCAKFITLMTSFNCYKTLMSSYVPILQIERNLRLTEDKGRSQTFNSGLFFADSEGH